MKNNRYYVVEQIVQALYALMKEKEYTDITVTDVIRKSQVSRASFYRHFSSISDVIDYSLNNMLDKINGEIISILLSYDEKKIRDFLFAYTYKNIEMHETLATCLPANTAVILSRIMTCMQQRNEPAAGYSTEEIYRLYARTGVINSVLMKWLSFGKKETVEEIVNYIMKYIILL